MDLSDISTAAVFGNTVGRSSPRPEFSTQDKPEGPREAKHARRAHGHHGGHNRHGRALGIFRQELKLALSASFRAIFAPVQRNYSETSAGVTPGEVASETLGVAERIVSGNREEGSRSLITFRQEVEQAASYTRETVGNDADIEDLDDAVGQVNAGLDDLEADEARNVESSASVLAVDVRSRQRSTIRIRTQEGDVVRLDLRRVDNFSATDVAVSNDDGASSVTNVEVSSRSRLVLRVNGDLNDAEAAAIQNIFAQAESIAHEFFHGDLAAAFDLAGGFEFDTEQLARVNLRFRSRSSSNVSYAALGTARPESPNSTGPAIPAPIADEAPVSSDTTAPVNSEQGVPASESAPDAAQPGAGTQPADHTPETAGPGEAAVDVMPLAGFFDLLSDFLRNIADGFESRSSGNGTSFRFHYSQSFKLEILRSVFRVAAPDESANTAEVAGKLIDDVATAGKKSQAPLW